MDYATLCISQWCMSPFFAFSLFFEAGRGLYLFFHVCWLAAKPLVLHTSIVGNLMGFFLFFWISVKFGYSSEDTCFTKTGIIWFFFFNKKRSFRSFKDFSCASIKGYIQISSSNQQSLLGILVFYYFFSFIVSWPWWNVNLVIIIPFLLLTK